MSVDLIKFLQKAEQTQLEDGLTLVEKSTYQGISHWWFDRFNMFHYIKSISIAENYRERLSAKLKKNFFFIERFLYDYIMWMLCKLFADSNKKSIVKGRKILAIDYNIRRGKLFSSSLVKTNIFFDSIFKKLIRNKYEIVTTSPIESTVTGLKQIIEKRINRKDIIHRPFNMYWSWKIWKKGVKARKYFKSVWGSLKKDSIFRNLWKYKNEDLYECVMSEVKFSFIYRFPRMVEYIEKAKVLLEEEKPDLILLECEYGGVAQALIVAAKEKKIPTLAVQHGTIFPFHEAYLFEKSEIIKDENARYSGYPLPDKTAVYGPNDKYYLTKVSAYPDNSVVITGQHRSDILVQLNEIYDKKKKFCELNLDLHKKTIVWTTQSHILSDIEKQKTYRVVYDAIRNLQGVQLLIKLHPAERDFNLYKNIAKELGVSPVIVRDINIYEILPLADIVITRHSTTATEAIMFSKPVIILNLGGEEDLTSYVKDNMAIGVYRETDFFLAVKNILYNEEIKKQLSVNRDKFIYENCYKIDGKATDRVVNLIEEMISKKGN